MPSAPCLLIRRAQILLSNGEFLVGDVLTQDGQIVQVAPAISAASETAIREIDALGLTLLPGVIDPQVHFRTRSGTQRDLHSQLCPEVE